VSGVYLVGGGTGALGRAVVQAALRSGASVIVPYRDPRKWEELRAAAPAGSVLLGGAAVDDNLAAFLDDAVGQLGRLDGVAAVAGAWAGSGSFEQAAADEWSRMLRANP
jgi:NAD(P)-dependent dehydrogenase (short-subunit alcohol dehydrogenase family)